MVKGKTQVSHCIFIIGPIANDAVKMLEGQGCRCVFGNGNGRLATISEELRRSQADGLIVRKGAITKEVLERANRLKAVCKHGVGVDNIDIDAATRLNIPVMITPFANYESVAEHALALILAMLKQIPRQDRTVRAGHWDKKVYQGEDLGGKTLGLIGYGRVGRRLAELLVPFAVQRVVYDPLIPAEKHRDGRLVFVQKLGELLSVADIVSLHCPLTSKTKGMIDRNCFRSMKKTAYIVNTARGAIINEKDLLDALANNVIAGAALDTLESEPPDPDNPLLKMENVTVTCHIGGVTTEAFRRMGMEAAKNILCALHGEPIDPACLVNPVVLAGKKTASPS